MDADELEERLLEFGVATGRLVDRLPDTRLGRHVAGQLIRCCTSPPPNYSEACAAESRADFIHKMSICLKELRETKTWLRFIEKAELVPLDQAHPLRLESQELAAIFGQSIVTAKANRKTKEG